MKAELIDSMGNDARVVNAARVSFNKEIQAMGEKDERLIHYLARHNHFTPFTHCFVTLRETVPIFVARQRFKHTVGFSYNEVSRRYVDEEPEFFYPDGWRKAAENKKQGSSDELIPEPPVWEREDSYGYHEYLKLAQKMYNTYIEAGIAPEQARMILPQSMYTSYFVSGSLSAWARAYNLRSQEDAQLEIQELAEQWNPIMSSLFPVSWRALTASATPISSKSTQKSSTSSQSGVQNASST